MAAPELRLEVSLNLTGFRNEVRKLTQIAQSEFNPLLKVNLDVKDYRAQLKALEKIKPVIKIEDGQLDAARARVATLNKSLATLRGATSTPIEIKLKYTEIGRPPSPAAGQIGRAVSGGIRGSQALEGAGRSELLNIRKMMSEAGMALGKITSLSKATASELRASIVPAFTNSGEQAVNGLAAGLTDSSSKIGKIAGKVGIEAVNGIKAALGIASPSRVFKQIGEFSVDGLELGFLNGLKDFKSKSIAEIRKIVALMRFELAKVSDLSGTGGPSVGSLRQRLVGQRAYTSPIGPLPVGSRAPYAEGTRGQFGGSGYEPRMVSRPYGQPLPAQSNSFLAFSRSVAQVQPSGSTPGSFLGFSQRAAQVAQASRGGGNVPPIPPAPPVPPRGGGGGSFGGMRLNVPQLPGSGVMRELGQEFGFAAKQVLLFGTAYKALAFIQGFPAQVGDAVGALQSFRNTLGAISPSAEEAAASSQFILDIVDKYNTPIQSARDGFTKLYASMKPTGFSGDEIRDLFLGISQAAATFGMSAEKVDRVNYAFAQMASKGQVMSEELKGQLGDVLPGAMGIFAEAAGFEGPDAITKFSKALEDGAYKGAAMKTLLTSVGAIMRKEFGPGAEGAARTFQGVINRMQNSLKLLYESFEPVAVGFLNSVVMPMTSGIKTLTDGFNAFFTGQAAQTAGGSALAKQLNDLKPSFDGILASLKSLIPSLQIFGNVILGVAKFLVTVAGNPVVGFLLKVYANVLLVNTAFTLLGGKILLQLTANISAAIARLVTFNATMNALAIASGKAGTSVTGTALQMQFLQAKAAGAAGPVAALLGSLLNMAAIGAIAIAVTIVVNGLTELKDAQERINRLRGARDPVGPAGPVPIMTAARRYAGATREKVTSDQQKQIEYLAQLRGELTKLQSTQTKAGGALSQTAVGNLGNVLGGLSRENISAKITETKLLIKNAEEVVNLRPGQFRTAAEQQRMIATTTVSGGGSGGAAGAKPPKGGKERESQIPQLTLALEKTKELSGIEMLIVNAQLMSNTAQLSSLELLKQLVEFKYEAKALGLEDLTTEERALKYKEIGLRREQAIAENQLKLQISLKKERDEIQQGFSATLAGYEQEANYQQMYLDLINQGVLPSLAKVRVEAEKAFAEGEKQLNQSIEQQEANIAGLEVTIKALKLEKNLTPEKQKQLEADEKRLEILKEDLRLRGLLKGTAPERKAAAVDAAEGGLAPKTAREYMGEGLEAAEERLRELTNTGYQVVQAANAIGDAFGTAFKGLVSGSMTAREALAGMFQSIADHFADMVAQMIAEYLKMALIKGLGALIGGIFGGGGGFAPLSNAQATSFNFNPGAMTGGTPWAFANGGIAPGGFTAFANGGMVTGPTMGLVGEGRYNEAIVPLPDGKSIPVQLAGGDGGNQIISNITVNVNNGQAQSNATGSNSSEMGRKIEGAVKQVIVGELRPGGLLASKK